METYAGWVVTHKTSNVCDVMSVALYSDAIAHSDGLMQKKRNPIANALELRLFCSKLSIHTVVSPYKTST